MLVYIESFFGDRIISGKRCTEKELREKFNKVIKLSQGENFTELFCRMFNFEEHPMSEDIRVDFIIDLDTYLVYAQHYQLR